MENNLRRVAVQVTAFLDPHNPGIVEAKLRDAGGVMHTFVDKAPLFTSETLDASSTYPQEGNLECKVLSQSQDAVGRCLVHIRTIESTEGRSEFAVLSSQLSN